MGKYRGAGPSATWPYDIVMMFCDLCLREIALGNRPSTHFTKIGWANLVDSFKKWTGKDYDRIQLKNKWDQLKKEWKLWKDLKKGATGFGWNPKRRTLDASDEWWKKKIQEFPAAKRFRYNGIDPVLEEKLDKMFMNTILPGEPAWAPNSGSFPTGLTEDGHGDFGDSESTKSLSGDANSLNESPRLSSGLKRASQPSSLAKGNRSKMVSSKSGVSGAAAEGVQQMLQTQIQELVDAATNSNKVTVAPSKSLSSITEAVAELDSIEELEENTELYGFAIDLLMQKDSREMFMALKPNKKVWYLKIEFEKSKRNTS
ncbi:L10-interacting MYB domain-containing protein [Dendrobium catenatum]|uniref:L10-interacting MYB domain-containing protein n=1 Tax=Dendrobium catenatum TaxID=906689 RepID=UPI0009F6BAAE|nr:L10-interacting MYB domain-containing protein [Dendrobium catenatum]XP_020680643.1 L10-interacting MYB domain-containing protein [Dendrobium catenatum]XP_028548963.1 L10-interacting MYB domain-containing protein [Dendrobium catenatum]